MNNLIERTLYVLKKYLCIMCENFYYNCDIYSRNPLHCKKFIYYNDPDYNTRCYINAMDSILKILAENFLSSGIII